MRIIGYDAQATARVFGFGDTELEAREEALQAAFDYIKSRPDTAPIGVWHFERRDDGVASVWR